MGLFSRSRSPISKKALNLRDLKKLKPRTQLIFFEWERQRKTLVSLQAVHADGVAMVLLRFPGGDNALKAASYLGVVPRGRGLWHDSNVLVLPEHENTLPTEPYRRPR